MSKWPAGDAMPGSHEVALAASLDRLNDLVQITLDALARGSADRGAPAPAGPFDRSLWELGELVDNNGHGFPRYGVGAERALAEVVRFLARGHTDPADSACVAYGHCPPLAVAAASELAVAVLNPSLDSWDQGPSAAAIEARLVEALCTLVGYPCAHSGGLITTGATASTITALALARGSTTRPTRVLCSEQAHVSVSSAAEVLGMSHADVAIVPCDAKGRLCVEAARSTIAAAPNDNWFLVGTAGTTDLGAIDPLHELADLSRSINGWLHVDAAYGGLLFSSKRRAQLDGISRAHSIALDTHKLGWQPIASGALLVAQRKLLEPFEDNVPYLSAPDDRAAGLVAQPSVPLATTRRADAVKLFVTLHALGFDGLGRLVDRCCELAHIAAYNVDCADELELYSQPNISTLLFRPRHRVAVDRDRWCSDTRRALLHDGLAVIGRTDLPGVGAGRRWLKLTFLNPYTTETQIEALFAAIRKALLATCPG